ncbi:MAG: O-antigen ligase family protein [Candidatus Doudnabacteria bacterium]|nr:O-antigen ligase family protein [Candidatus Doudnabacteria bacterium]
MTILLGLILALVPSYLLRFTIFGIPTTVLEILLVVFLLLTVARFRIKDLGKLKNLGKLNYAIALFVLAGIAAVIISPEPLKALGQLKAFIIEPVLFFYAILLTVKDQQSMVRVLRWLFAGAIIISMFGLIQYLTNLGLPLRFWGSGLEPKRLTSFFEYPNALALYLGPLVVFFFALFLKKFYFINRHSLLAGLVIITAALILTYSRGAWIAVILAVLILLFKTYSAKKAVSLAIVIVLAGLLLSPIRSRLTLTDASSLAHRDLWQISMDKIVQSPIFGNGLYGFRDTLQKAHFQGEILNYPHNIILNFWLETGLLGLLSFFAVIYLSLAQYKKSPAALKLGAALALVAILLHGLVDVPYFKNDLAVLFWFILSLFFIEN